MHSSRGNCIYIYIYIYIYIVALACDKDLNQIFYAECFKKSFTILEAHINYSEDMHIVLRCHNVVKHTEFDLG
jgi:hypothetical protein